MRKREITFLALLVTVFFFAMPLEAVAAENLYIINTFSPIVNADFESGGTPPTSWTAVYGSWSTYAVSGFEGSKCAVGRDTLGDPVVLKQALSSLVRDQVEGLSVELSFWFKSSYSDDAARAIVKYNGVEYPGKWIYHSPDTSTPWTRVTARVLNLPTSVTSFEVLIIGQDGAGGDLGTKIYVDRVMLKIFESPSTVDTTKGNLRLLVAVCGASQDATWRYIQVLIGSDARSEYSDKQYYVSFMSVTVEMRPLHSVWWWYETDQQLPGKLATLTTNSYGQCNDKDRSYDPRVAEEEFHLTVEIASALMILALGGLAYELVAVGATSLPAFAFDYAAETIHLPHLIAEFACSVAAVYDPLAQGGSDYSTSLKWAFGPYAPFVVNATTGQMLTWKYPYPKTGAWYLRVVASVDWAYQGYDAYHVPCLIYAGTTTTETAVYCW